MILGFKFPNFSKFGCVLGCELISTSLLFWVYKTENRERRRKR